jgi:hypothetical protein
MTATHSTSSTAPIVERRVHSPDGWCVFLGAEGAELDFTVVRWQTHDGEFRHVEKAATPVRVSRIQNGP